MGAAPLRHSRPRPCVAALIGLLSSLVLAQSGPAAPEQGSRSSALPRQIWAVAYTPDAAAGLNAAKLSNLRKRGVNAAVAFRLTKAQRARLRQLNSPAKLALLP